MIWDRRSPEHAKNMTMTWTLTASLASVDSPPKGPAMSSEWCSHIFYEFYILMLGQNGRNPVGDISTAFYRKNFCVLLQISPSVVLNGPIDTMSALVSAFLWPRTVRRQTICCSNDGRDQLRICVTTPQCVQDQNSWLAELLERS